MSESRKPISINPELKLSLDKMISGLSKYEAAIQECKDILNKVKSNLDDSDNINCLRGFNKISIDTLNITVRTASILKNEYINTIEDILIITGYGNRKHELLKIPRLGKKGYSELIKEMETFYKFFSATN